MSSTKNKHKTKTQHGMGTPQEILIDLGRYQRYLDPNAKVYAGKKLGELIRDESEIDKAIEKAEHIIIQFPKDTSSLRPSFLESFFKNVVVKLGKQGFYEKVEVRNSNVQLYEVKEDLEEAIDRILWKKSFND